MSLGCLLRDPPEDCRSDGGSSSGCSSSAGEPGGAESSSSPRAPEPETPELHDAEGTDGHLAAMQRPVARSKIKVGCRLCPRRHLHHALASGSGAPAPLPAAPARAPEPRRRTLARHSCTCPWAAARLLATCPLCHSTRAASILSGSRPRVMAPCLSPPVASGTIEDRAQLPWFSCPPCVQSQTVN